MKILTLWFAIILFVGVCSAQTSDRRDGNWWIQLDHYAKLNYVTGFFDGMDFGRNLGVWGISDKNDKDVCIGKVGESYTKYDEQYFSKVTNYQLVDGLDTFYKDYRNRRIKLFGAVWLVVNGIAGTPQDKLDKMTENWRKNAAAQ